MPRSRDLLQRFRPAGAPGTAARAGVPADRVAELTAELEPVLALLDGVTQDAERIRADADREAARRRRDAEDRARALVAHARRDAEAERAEAAARVNRQAAAETVQTMSAAHREADEIRARGDERMPGYVERVVAAVRNDVMGREP